MNRILRNKPDKSVCFFYAKNCCQYVYIGKTFYFISSHIISRSNDMKKINERPSNRLHRKNII